MGKFIDISGMKFGRLTPIEPIHINGSLKWKCKCDCGKETIADSSKLRSGHTKSCGCLQRERVSESSKKDITGTTFGRLFVIEQTSNMGEKTMYLCKCSCGNTTIVNRGNLVSGATTSCECYRKEKTSKLNRIHGEHGTRLYRCWRNMIDRCTNKNNKEYKNYGGRDIFVCEQWLLSFESFYQWATSNGYSEELTIERIDVNGNYCPENCTWIELNKQAKNRTNNHRITFDGETMILSDWARKLGVSPSTIKYRLKNNPKLL